MHRAPVAAITAAALTALLARPAHLLGRRVSGWTRTNYRDRPVSLSGGAAAAIGGGLGALLTAPRERRAGLGALVSLAAAAGAYDDLVAPRVERRADKGLRGHLEALRQGRPSGGVVKAAAIGSGALLAARAPGRTVLDVAGRAVATAAVANLVNLLDLRPGRAGKVVLAAGVLGGGGPGGSLGAAGAGAAAATLPADLAERRMLGDLGANVLGALLGARLAEAGPVVRAGLGAAAVAANVASERVSFSAVIEANPVLRRLDGLGRRA